MTPYYADDWLTDVPLTRESQALVDAAAMTPLRVMVSRAEAEELRIGNVYADTADRAAFRLVAVDDDRPDGRVELWFEQVPHCPVGRHHDTLALDA